MGYSYSFENEPRPFVPGTIDFAKKKARELRKLVPSAKLSDCQQGIAKALHWESWFALEQAIKSGLKPSETDEAVGSVEANNRWVYQIGAIQKNLALYPGDAEYVVDQLGLTCSKQTAKQRQKDHGPWGRFVGDPTQIAPGIVYGECAKFRCYRLDADRIAEMPAALRLDTNGWYMCEDYGWRVELSFPDAFPAQALADAKKQSEQEPFVFEMLNGHLPENAHVSHSLAVCRKLAIDAPLSWFAISAFPDWMFGEGVDRDAEHDLVAVSALQGRELVLLLDARGGWGPREWGSASVNWLVLKSNDLYASVNQDFHVLDHAVIPLSGLQATKSQPVASHPVKQGPFCVAEFDARGGCISFNPAVSKLAWGPSIVIA
mgnify:CR=1 FL=1